MKHDFDEVKNAITKLEEELGFREVEHEQNIDYLLCQIKLLKKENDSLKRMQSDEMVHKRPTP